VNRVILGDEARADALDAYRFYEQRRIGLGDRFRAHLDLALSRIQRSPELYPLIYRGVRRRLVERFPYAVYYRIYPGTVFIVAVMHAKQSPRTWKTRARSSEPG
jgi:plasmid stabilization system protein ParE